MIKVDFYTTKSGELLGFRISGHSNYAKSGNDIICASVSSVAYMVVNTITDIIHAVADIEVDDGYMYFMIQRKYIPSCQNILAGLKLHLIALEEQYSDNISVNYMEV